MQVRSAAHRGRASWPRCSAATTARDGFLSQLESEQRVKPEVRLRKDIGFGLDLGIGFGIGKDLGTQRQ